MINNLEELVKNRRELIEVHKKNDFTDGIRALLTDLYPDTAHFIYELLQNAEDMQATKVKFILYQDKICFNHNGTKRDFNVHDIDAITNIGHNAQKKDDPTSIGKFGVGFKAVFAYTSTPEIHSGQYHFRIKNYFVPEFENVDEIDVYDSKGIKWTKFIFPFNNEKKSKEDAVLETIDSLKALNDSSVLFLNNIKKIEYVLPDGRTGYIERDDTNLPFVKIKYKAYNSYEKNTYWLKYNDIIDFVDDQKKHKKLNISIAYALEIDKNKKTRKIIPINGNVFIYFPAEKEYSGLKFHINAPFASTVARDSVRNCKENEILIRKVAALVANSVESIKSLGLLDSSFFEVLPSLGCGPVFYQTIFDYLYDAFRNNDYLPLKNSTDYTSSLHALIGSPMISNLFPNGELEKITDIRKKWIINAPLKNSNADNFIRSLGITEFSNKEFLELFKNSFNELEKYIQTKDFVWLKNFYSACNDSLKVLDLVSKRVIIEQMKKMKLIKSMPSTNMMFFTPNDIYILPNNVQLINCSTPIVNKELYMNSKKKINSILLEFLKDVLEIEEYGEKVEIERLLKKYNGNPIEINYEYFKALEMFVHYRKNASLFDDLSFEDKKIFVGVKKDKLYMVKASELVITDVYGNQDGKLLFDFYDNKYEFWEGYMKNCFEKQTELILSFAKELGAIDELKVERVNARNNPAFYTVLYDSCSKLTDKGINKDYTINNVDKILDLKEIKYSKLIWNALKKNFKVLNTIHKAEFSANARARIKECDSTLFYFLKNKAWIPNKEGKMFKPKDILIKDLNDYFQYDENDSALFHALEIGGNALNSEKEIKRLKKQSESLGYRMIKDEEYELFKKWEAVEARKERKRNLEEFSIKNEIEKLDRKQIKKFKEESPDDSINNVERRERNIENTFKESVKMKTIERKLFSKIIPSSKEEKINLYEWYKGKCQICGTKITTYNGKSHFIAKNVIDSSILPSELLHTIDLGWNSLCLCPNCSAKYSLCTKKVSGILKQIEDIEVFDGDYGEIEMDMELENKRQKIHYVPKHFISLQKAIEILKDEEKQNN